MDVVYVYVENLKEYEYIYKASSVQCTVCARQHRVVCTGQIKESREWIEHPGWYVSWWPEKKIEWIVYQDDKT